MKGSQLVLSFSFAASLVHAFQPALRSDIHVHFNEVRNAPVRRLLSEKSASDGDEEDAVSSSTNLDGISSIMYESIVEASEKYFDVSPHQFKALILRQHKPLGCTAEECLNPEEDGTKHVFISKVVEDGNAEQNGIMVGDVIVGVSGAFKDVVNVVENDLDRMYVVFCKFHVVNTLADAISFVTLTLSRHM